MIFKTNFFRSNLKRKTKKKKRNKSKFSWIALLFKNYFIKIQPNISEQKMKRQRIYDLLNADTKPKNVFEKIRVSLWPPSSPGLKILDYGIRSVLVNKINATSYPDIGSLQPAIEEKWNKI